MVCQISRTCGRSQNQVTDSRPMSCLLILAENGGKTSFLSLTGMPLLAGASAKHVLLKSSFNINIASQEAELI